jgi:hypothetical protein
LSEKSSPKAPQNQFAVSAPFQYVVVVLDHTVIQVNCGFKRIESPKCLSYGDALEETSVSLTHVIAASKDRKDKVAAGSISTNLHLHLLEQRAFIS